MPRKITPSDGWEGANAIPMIRGSFEPRSGCFSVPWSRANLGGGCGLCRLVDQSRPGGGGAERALDALNDLMVAEACPQRDPPCQSFAHGVAAGVAPAAGLAFGRGDVAEPGEFHHVGEPGLPGRPLHVALRLVEQREAETAEQPQIVRRVV